MSEVTTLDHAVVFAREYAVIAHGVGDLLFSRDPWADAADELMAKIHELVTEHTSFGDYQCKFIEHDTVMITRLLAAAGWPISEVRFDTFCSVGDGTPNLATALCSTDTGEFSLAEEDEIVFVISGNIGC